MTVDLAELSLHLAEYFARVCAGETIFVEEQSRVLVKLAPVSDRGDVDQQEMEDLVRRGIARAPMQPPGPRRGGCSQRTWISVRAAPIWPGAVP